MLLVHLYRRRVTGLSAFFWVFDYHDRVACNDVGALGATCLVFLFFFSQLSLCHVLKKVSLRTLENRSVFLELQHERRCSAPERVIDSLQHSRCCEFVRSLCYAVRSVCQVWHTLECSKL